MNHLIDDRPRADDLRPADPAGRALHATKAAAGKNTPAARFRLSVVIPVYNGAATIGSLLDTLLAQSDARCEIIVVDDCSTDTTAAVLETYAARGVTCLRTARNSGAGSARNVGAAAAAGRTLLFFDSDDVPSPVLLPTVLATLDAYPEATFAGYLLAKQPLHAVDRSVLKRTADGTPRVPRVFLRHAYASKLLVGRWLVTASSLIVRKSLFDEHGGFADGLRHFDDPELFTRLSAAAPFLQIPEVLAIYRIPAAPPADRTKIGVANPFIHSLRRLAEQYGARYRLLSDVFALRMAILARASGAPVHACLASLKEAGVGAVGRAAGHVLLSGASPAVLGHGVRLYRRARMHRTS